jgi:nitroreductase
VELDVCIKGRRSVREYTNESVSKEQIGTVLDAGTWAPTGMHREPWKFIVPLAKQFSTDVDIVCYNAPVLIFVCTEKDEQWDNVNLLDCVLAAQNMFLKAYDLGLGSCYMGFVNYINNKPESLKKVGVPENCKMMVPFIMGHPKVAHSKGKRNKPTVLKWSG